MRRSAKIDSVYVKREFILDLENLAKLDNKKLVLYPGDTIFIDHTVWLTIRDVFNVATTAAVIASAIAQVIYASRR